MALNLDHLTIRNGRSTDPTFGGGGLQVTFNGSARVSDAVFTGNVSAQGGGGIGSTGSLVVTNTTISGNTSQGGPGGGGVHAFAGTAQITATTVSFAPGQTTMTVTVDVIGDRYFEKDEEFKIILSAPVGATLTRSTGTGTIVNDDSIFSFSAGLMHL